MMNPPATHTVPYHRFARGAVSLGLVLTILFSLSRCGGDGASSGSIPSPPASTPPQSTPPPAAQVTPPAPPTAIPVQTPPPQAETPLPVALAAPEPEALNGSPDITHRTRRGDTLWELAEHYYGDAQLWPNIYRANPAIGANPDYLITGVNIAIPSLEGSPGNLTAADASNLYQGFLAAHRAFQVRGDERADLFLRLSEKYQ